MESNVNNDVRVIALCDITVDDNEGDKSRTQIRAKTYPGEVRRYAGVIETFTDEDDVVARGFPPIDVEEVRGASEVTFWLVDGFHRTAAAKRAGKTHIIARVSPERKLEERLVEAGKANLKHGISLKPKEKKAHLKRYVRAGFHREVGPRGGTDKRQPFKPSKLIRQEIGGCAAKTFWKWLQEVSPNTYRALWEAENPGSVPGDDEIEHSGYDDEEVKEMEALRKIGEALTLIDNLQRTLKHRQSLQMVSDGLWKVAKKVNAKVPSPFD